MDAPSASAPAAASDRWPLWHRFAFRYLLLHYLLYALPRPFDALLGTLSGLCRWVATEFQQPWLNEAPFRWAGKWAMELSKVEAKVWQPLTTWMDQHGLTPYEVIHQRTGSGDTGHDVARLLAIVAAALAGALLWMLLQRGDRGHPRLGRWLHLMVRFDLAFWMFSYGFAKFYGGQFGDLSLMRLTQEIGDTTPMGMVGTFMQASKPYELFSGAGEVLGGLLLFHRATAALGACVTIAVMTNVCALNWLCGVPVKLFSAHLLLYAVFLLAPFCGRLRALFLTNQPSAPVDLRVVRVRWAGWLLQLVGWSWVLGSLWLTHVQGRGERPWMKGREKPSLYGVWLVDKMLLDGQEVAATDVHRWRFLAIDRGTMVWARDVSGQRQFFDCTWDPATGNAQVKPRVMAPATGTASASAPASRPAETWTCTTGTKVVPVDVPLLIRNEDRGRKVDGTRRTLVVKGRLGGQDLELHTVEKVFRLQTGFRLRQELPDGW